MKKIEVSEAFRDRLMVIIHRRNESVSSFARRCGLDRSALSQFLDKSVIRLPRAETLAAIAKTEGVSIDWLLGIRQDEENFGELTPMMNVEAGDQGSRDSALAEWLREASGYKIRYSPSSLPDLLRTKAVTDHEFQSVVHPYVDVKTGQSQEQLDYSRLPDTDMEVVLPFQRLENLAAGADIWKGLARGVRQAQIEHINRLLEELYPTFRLFLYDGVKNYCAPFTVFGPKRAAVYLGDMYLVINSVDQIRELAMRFDNIIRVASVSPDRAAEWMKNLKVV
ncbi:MAG: helix-turn-helix transcriptional regulator [Pseudomonadota bacterium]